MSLRDQFQHALFNGPMLRGDAVVLLAGEDAQPRADFAIELMKQNAAQYLVITGGKHDGKRWIGAQALHDQLIGSGVSPSRFIVDPVSQNTFEQACFVAAYCSRHEWQRILLVASGYHLPRAYLTFIKALPETVHVLPVSASQSKWSGCPDGMTATRLALVDIEWAKIAEYTAHVATVEEGLATLTKWEAA